MGLDQCAGWLIEDDSVNLKPNTTIIKSGANEKVVDINLYKGKLGAAAEEDWVDPYENCMQDVVYTWRKHARLQEYMRRLWHLKRNTEIPYGVLADDFNAERLILNRGDLVVLYELIKQDNLPFCPDGFFWGQQFQEESMKKYKEQDLEFCEAAIKWTEEGKTAWYGCDW